MSKKLLIVIGAGIVFFILFIVLLTVLPRIIDRSQPQLFVSKINENGVYKAAMPLHLTAFDEQGRLALLRIQLDYRVIFEQKLKTGQWESDYTIPAAELTEGAHKLDIIVIDNSFHKNRALVDFHFSFDTTAPSLQWASSEASALPGNVLPVFIRVPNESNVTLTGTCFSRSLLFHPILYQDHLFRALVPVTTLQKKGAYTLNVKAVDKAGNESTVDFPFEIRSRTYPFELIVLSTEKSTLLTDRSAAIITQQKMEAGLSASAVEQFWKGTFMRPITGIVSSPYGIQRKYNDGTMVSYHKGLDIANKQGTPVMAANSGKVVLADTLPLYGNCVFIDHGQQLFTLYFHMHALLVQTNQFVEKNEQIGIVGTTGISTGPHLHWELRLQGVSIDPGQWEQRDFSKF